MTDQSNRPAVTLLCSGCGRVRRDVELDLRQYLVASRALADRAAAELGLEAAFTVFRERMRYLEAALACPWCEARPT